jgi:O-methyltransferase domain
MGDTFARKRLLGLVSGGVLAQCCYAVAELGVADLLAGGARPVSELAAECGADPVALDRLLGDLAHFGLFRHCGADGYELTSVGELLRTDVLGSLRQTAIMHGEEVARAFVAITHTMRTGLPAFDAVHGRPFYDYLNEHPVVANTMAEAMGAVGPPPVLARYRPLDSAGTVVDVGGGDGGLLAAVLTAHPALRGVLLELPGAVRAARVRLTDAGLLDRAELVAGSFFDDVPGGGDVYVLARVLHNWADEHAVAILHRVRQAMPDRARLIVLERFRSEGGGSVTTAMVDLLMLGLMDGRQRTEAEYVALLDQAGFKVLAVAPPAGEPDDRLIEAIPR